jgi:Protein of unknown function (DUF3093)
VDHAERLTVPLRWWVQGTMMVASFWLAILAATPDHESIAWGVTAVALALMVAAFVSYGSARVEVRDGHLRAGRARVPLSYVGSVAVLDADGMRRQAGVDADARAYLLLRPYLKRGVRVDLTDPADPTPYWLVSCRRPEELAAALEHARTA